MRRTKHEVLNHFLVFREQHLRHLLKEWLAYYHEFRPHQGLGNVPISGLGPTTEDAVEFRREDVLCREQLGSLLKHYERKAV